MRRTDRAGRLWALAALLLSAHVPGTAAAGPKAPEGAAVKPTPAAANVTARGEMINSRLRFERARKGHVAFIGGSITEMNGYRPMVCEMLTRRFPQTQFTFTDAGIASTCSTTGAFRLARDVLSKGPVDLLFVEFAVNDDQDAHHAARECIRGMEGIARRTRNHNPNADIVITYFVNPDMLRLLQAGKTPLPVAAHEKVAQRYAIPTIHLAREVAQRIAAGEFDWKKFGGVHPAPFGNRLCAEMIRSLLDAAWAKPLPKNAAPKPHALPEPIDPASYARGRLVDVATAKAGDGWKLHVPPWKQIKGSFRRRFAGRKLLTSDRPGAELTLAFEGTAVGAYVLAGPDAGTVEARVDGGEPRKVDLYHHYSRSLHYPRTVMFAADLKPGPHKLTLRMTAERNARSGGTAMRVLHFVAN